MPHLQYQVRCSGWVTPVLRVTARRYEARPVRGEAGGNQTFYLDLETAIHEDEKGNEIFKVNCAVVMSSRLAYKEETDEFYYPTWCFIGEKTLEELCNFLFFDEDSLLA